MIVHSSRSGRSDDNLSIVLTKSRNVDIPACLGTSVTGQGAQAGMMLSSRDMPFRDAFPFFSSSSFRISGAQHRMSLLCCVFPTHPLQHLSRTDRGGFLALRCGISGRLEAAVGHRCRDSDDFSYRDSSRLLLAGAAGSQRACIAAPGSGQ